MILSELFSSSLYGTKISFKYKQKYYYHFDFMKMIFDEENRLQAKYLILQDPYKNKNATDIIMVRLF